MSALLSWASHLYLFAAIIYVVYFIRSNAKLALAAVWAMAAGFAVHAGVILQRFFEHGYTPISNLGEGLSFLGWVLAGLFLWMQRRYKLPIIGTFVAPLVVALVLPAVLMRGEVKPLPEALKLAGMPLHVTVAFIGMAAFALATGVGAAYLLLERQMKSKNFGVLFSRLPSLEVLDSISARLMRWGFVALSVTLMTGAFFAKQVWGDYWRWDPKLTVSLVAWLVFAGLLHARLFAGWRGRRAAVLTIVGFVILFGSFLWFHAFPMGLHAGEYTASGGVQ